MGKTNKRRLGTHFNGLEKSFDNAEEIKELIGKLQVLQPTDIGHNLDSIAQIQNLCLTIGNNFQRLLDTERTLKGWKAQELDNRNWLI